MRWLKFSAVGAMGAAWQLALLALFTRAAGMHYLVATALSVEAATAQLRLAPALDLG